MDLGSGLAQAADDLDDMVAHRPLKLEGGDHRVQCRAPGDADNLAFVHSLLQVPGRHHAQLFRNRARRIRIRHIHHQGLVQIEPALQVFFQLGEETGRRANCDLDDPKLARLLEQPRDFGARQVQGIGDLVLAVSLLVVHMADFHQQMDIFGLAGPGHFFLTQVSNNF
jgi:hypothetical protein